MSIIEYSLFGAFSYLLFYHFARATENYEDIDSPVLEWASRMIAIFFLLYSISLFIRAFISI